MGFIGVGVMGRHMAKKLLKAHFPVTVYDTRASAVKVGRGYLDYTAAVRATGPGPFHTLAMRP